MLWDTMGIVAVCFGIGILLLEIFEGDKIFHP